MRGDGQVVVVPFNSCGIEVAPGFPATGGGYLICDANDRGRYKWVHPGGELAVFNDADARFVGNVRKLSQMLKQWQRYCDVPIKSFQMEAVVKEALETVNWANCDEFWFDWLIRDVLAHLVGRPYLDHALMIAEFMIALECSVRSRADFKLLSAREIVADAASMIERANASRTLTASVPGEADELSVTPDKVFGLEFAATGRRNYFCLEADRSTMPITRRTLAQSSFRKKLLVYHHAHQAKRHIAQWGIPGFRVLTIAKSAERIGSMIEVVAEITAGQGSNVFLFADTNMASSVDPFATVWVTGKGRRTQLLE